MSYALYRMVPIALTTMNNPIFWIFAAIHSFVLGEPRDLKFGTQVPRCRWKIFPERGVVRVTWAISTLWTLKISPQHVVGIQVISTTRYVVTQSDSIASWLSVYYTAHCNPPTSQLRFVQDLLYKSFCTLPRSTQCMGVAWSLSRQSRQRSPEEKSCRPMFWQERDNLSRSNYRQ